MTSVAQQELTPSFEPINAGYNAVFQAGRLSLGLVIPLESYPNSPVPTMAHDVERVQLAEALGLAAVWLRDVPFNVPSFGDAGQMYDPFVYLGALAAQTQHIALGVSSIILPLRHPAHVAKAAATADVLSRGRLLLGIASGDRPEEYPALNVPFDERGERFREAYDYLRRMSDHAPQLHGPFGRVHGGMDLLPKPTAGKLPLLVTGSSQQSPEWLATHADGWMTYPRPTPMQSRLIDTYRHNIASAGLGDKPVMEPLYIDLVDDPQTPASPIHLGFRLGTEALVGYLKAREAIGVNHIALNLRFCVADTEWALQTLEADVLPHFSTRNSS